MSELESRYLYAAHAGDVDSLVTLLEAGADANYRDRFGFSALHKAVLGSNIECVKFLCEETEIDLYGVDSESQSALHHCKDLSILQYLLEERSLHTELSTADSSNETPFVKIVRRANMQCLLYLLENFLDRLNLASIRTSRNDTLLHLVVRSPSSHVGLIRTLTEVPLIDPTVTDPYGRTFLHAAMEDGSWRLCSVIISLAHERVEAGDDRYGRLLVMPDLSREKKTPLHFAAMAGQARIVEILLQSPFVRENVSLQDQTRATPLLCCCRVLRGTMDRLIDIGKNVRTEDAAYFASRERSLRRIVEILIDAMGNDAARERTEESDDDVEGVAVSRTDEKFLSDINGDTPVTVLLPATSLTSIVSVRELDLQHKFLNSRLQCQESESEIRRRDSEILDLKAQLVDRDRVVEAMENEKRTLQIGHLRVLRSVEDERDATLKRQEERLRLMRLQMEEREESVLQSLSDLEHEKDEKIALVSSHLDETEAKLEKLRAEFARFRDRTAAKQKQNADLVLRMRRRIEKMTYRQDSYKEKIRQAKETLQYL